MEIDGQRVEYWFAEYNVQGRFLRDVQITEDKLQEAIHLGDIPDNPPLYDYALTPKQAEDIAALLGITIGKENHFAFETMKEREYHP
jgi:hypothetical protein